MALPVTFTHPSNELAYRFMIHIVTLNKLRFGVHPVFMGNPCIIFPFFKKKKSVVPNKVLSKYIRGTLLGFISLYKKTYIYKKREKSHIIYSITDESLFQSRIK